MKTKDLTALLNPSNDYEKRSDIFCALISRLKNGMTFTLTEKDCAPEDDFLIFSAYDKQVITIHTNRVPYWVEFDTDEPMLLENCPTSFFRTLLQNILDKNYTITK